MDVYSYQHNSNHGAAKMKPNLLKRHFGKRPKLARMQLVHALRAQQLHGAHSFAVIRDTGNRIDPEFRLSIINSIWQQVGNS